MAMNLEFTSIVEFGKAPAAELLTQAFADYIIKLALTPEALDRLGRSEGLDFLASQVLFADAIPVGAALIARRGQISRLAGMALLPRARQHGLGRLFMERLLADARAREDKRMELEVIEQNAAAVRLYEKTGFTRRRRLLGFSRATPEGVASEPAPAVVDLQEVAAVVASLGGEMDWPWQIAGDAVAQRSPLACGYMLEGAWAAVVNPDGPTAIIRALAVVGTEDAAGRAGRLLLAVMARCPAKEWCMSALWPEELSAWFTTAGFNRQEITQWQMVRKIDRNTLY